MKHMPWLLLLRQRCKLARDYMQQRVHQMRRPLLARKFNMRQWLSMDLGELGRRLGAALQKSSSSGKWLDIREMRASDWPAALRWTMLSVVFVVVFGATALFSWSASWQQLAHQSQEVEALKARYVQVAVQSGLKPRYEQQLAQIEAQFGGMLEMIPASLETVHVLQQISRAAQASGLRLQWFKPGAEIQEDAYVILPVDVRLVGNYHAVGRFLEAVSRMKHLITVDVLLETADSAPGQLVLATKIKAYRGDIEPKSQKVGHKQPVGQPSHSDTETTHAPR